MSNCTRECKHAKRVSCEVQGTPIADGAAAAALVPFLAAKPPRRDPILTSLAQRCSQSSRSIKREDSHMQPCRLLIGLSFICSYPAFLHLRRIRCPIVIMKPHRKRNPSFHVSTICQIVYPNMFVFIYSCDCSLDKLVVLHRLTQIFVKLLIMTRNRT